MLDSVVEVVPTRDEFHAWCSCNSKCVQSALFSAAQKRYTAAVVYSSLGYGTYKPVIHHTSLCCFSFSGQPVLLMMQAGLLACLALWSRQPTLSISNKSTGRSIYSILYQVYMNLYQYPRMYVTAVNQRRPQTRDCRPFPLSTLHTCACLAKMRRHRLSSPPHYIDIYFLWLYPVYICSLERFSVGTAIQFRGVRV